MKCDACGAPIENGVCTYCGKKFPLNEAAQQTSPTEDSETTTFKATIRFEESDTEPQKKKRSFKQSVISFILVFFILSCIVSLFDGDDKKDSVNETSQSPLVVTMKNADGTEQKGDILIQFTDGDVRYTAVDDWFFGGVLETDCRYGLIVNQEKSPIVGVFANRNGLERNVRLLKAGNGYYKIPTSDTEYYSADVVAKTMTEEYEMNDYSDEGRAIREAIDTTIGEEYRGPDYKVEILGTQKRPQVNVVVEKKSFDQKEYKALTKALAEALKELDMDVSYMIILFQTDNSTLAAAATVDNVSEFSDAKDINWTTY